MSLSFSGLGGRVSPINSYLFFAVLAISTGLGASSSFFFSEPSILATSEEASAPSGFLS